jgi:hypothetical protein
VSATEAVREPAAGVDGREIAQRQVAIDCQRRRQAERADAADRVAGQRLGLLMPSMRGRAPNAVLGLAVVEPGIAARDDQHHLPAEPHRQVLAICPGATPERLRRLGTVAVLRPGR